MTYRKWLFRHPTTTSPWVFTVALRFRIVDALSVSENLTPLVVPLPTKAVFFHIMEISI